MVNQKINILKNYSILRKKNVISQREQLYYLKMEPITFNPAQVHILNLMSFIKSSEGLEQLRQQLAAFYAKQVDEEMDYLWESGQWDEKKLEELRGSHFRTPYK